MPYYEEEKRMIINNREYRLPELDFNAMCELEDMGIALTDMDKKVLTTVRGFLALAMNGDFHRAGKELEAHLSKGGSLEQMLQEINEAVERSGFSRAQPEHAEEQWSEPGNAGRSEPAFDSIRQLIEESYLPMALRMGVDYHLFWQLNPRRLQPFVKAYQEEQKRSLSGQIMQHGSAAST